MNQNEYKPLDLHGVVIVVTCYKDDTQETRVFSKPSFGIRFIQDMESKGYGNATMVGYKVDSEVKDEWRGDTAQVFARTVE